MIKCVIFDMDGVIANTQKYHSITESEVLAQYGIKISPEEITQRFSGVNDKFQFETLFTENNLPKPNIEEIVTKKWLLIATIPSIEPIEGVLEMIKTIKEQKIPISIASSSPLSFINHVVNSLKIRDLFSNLTSGEEVQNGKPSPDIFILSSNRMNITDYSNCLVVEDGISGMQGAKSANMKCLALSENHIDWVDYCTDNFTKIDIKNILHTTN